MIIKLDEGALKAAKFPDSFIQTMRHLVRQIGALTNETTLPELASITDGLAPIVDGLTITVTATNATVSDLITDTSEQQRSDAHLLRRLDDADAAQIEQLSRDSLLRLVEELRIDRQSLDFNLADMTRRIKDLEDR